MIGWTIDDDCKMTGFSQKSSKKSSLGPKIVKNAALRHLCGHPNLPPAITTFEELYAIENNRLRQVIPLALEQPPQLLLKSVILC